jgi:hypothetical protein
MKCYPLTSLKREIVSSQHHNFEEVVMPRFGSAYNLTYDAIAARRGAMASLDLPDLVTDDERVVLQIIDAGKNPEEILVPSKADARLDHALAALPPDLRECLVLHELEEFHTRRSHTLPACRSAP